MYQVVVGSGSLEATLQAVAATDRARPLAITDASRADLIVGLAAANASPVGPHVSAILATGAEGPAAIGNHSSGILQVMQGSSSTPFKLFMFGHLGMCEQHVCDHEPNSHSYMP